MQQSPLPPDPPPMNGQQPAAPTAVVVGQDGPSITVTTVPGAPTTREQYQALVARRDELSNQLLSAQGRRDRLVRELRTAPPDAQGIEARVKLLDQRILQLEHDIDVTGQQIAAAPAWAITTQSMQAAAEPHLFGIFSSDQATGMSIVFTVLVLFPLAIARARAIWKRSSHPSAPPGWNDVQQRIQRMEQAVDVIAVEVERVSESQRFLTRVLAEPGQPAGAASGAGAGAGSAGNGGAAPRAIAGGPMEPVAVGEQEKEKVRRG